ncbi:alpha/beta fold hydrolase [Jiangella alba]|uniref:Pimeloyl-ACP methyl ester carboxylesterase n=1 Tax=Jiangella alba TaxID=561176 RepID=A0A1H5J1B5_9ACTN|nr:alpha/beta hydrolase [Jiangella alba]SEE46299.1 Pimeloyl-ACP methyl ester carboxylesterase [Jiangella alba]
MDQVISADGTTIAYTTQGAGPALVLVNTTMDDHHGLDATAAALAGDFTVVGYDRRGVGRSGAGGPYAPEREIEDLAAVIQAAGGSAALAAGSGGCGLVLAAATGLGAAVTGIYLFEPPFIVDDSRPPVPADWVEQVAALVAADRRGDAVELFMTRVVGVPAEYIGPMKADPSWETMAGYAHTLGHDGQILAGTQDGTPLPTDRWNVSQTAVVAVGEQSEPFFHTGAKALVTQLPNGRYETLPGLDHSAFWTAPDAVAASMVTALRTAPSHGPNG